jgi:hypothetical protein
MAQVTAVLCSQQEQMEHGITKNLVALYGTATTPAGLSKAAREARRVHAASHVADMRINRLMQQPRLNPVMFAVLTPRRDSAEHMVRQEVQARAGKGSANDTVHMASIGAMFQSNADGSRMPVWDTMLAMNAKETGAMRRTPAELKAEYDVIEQTRLEAMQGFAGAPLEEAARAALAIAAAADEGSPPPPPERKVGRHTLSVSSAAAVLDTFVGVARACSGSVETLRE